MSTRKKKSSRNRPPSPGTFRHTPTSQTITAGIDVGAISTKAAVLKDGRLLSHAILPTGVDCALSARQCLALALRRAGVSADSVHCIAATGYGRSAVACAGATFTEITCHAEGAAFLFPGTETVIDIGGQDSKIILTRGGRVRDFVMNDRCAAGTGRFLEVMSRALQTPLDRMGRESLRAPISSRALTIRHTCAVFAESEVISLLAEGHPKRVVLFALHDAIAGRILSMAHRFRMGRKITITGGVAKNEGVVYCVGRRLRTRLCVPPEPQIAGAIGAALLVLHSPTKKGQPS